MNRISAKIIADSKNESGQRATSFVLVFPRIVLAEFNTHRMLSRNSASSRAIPYKKLLSKAWNEGFTPIAFQKDHSGMQGTEYFSGVALWFRIQLWLLAKTISIGISWVLSKFNVTKQICNRLLEPFLYHTVICTGTEWQNFFALRDHPAAEIHIADLAHKMLIAYNESTPTILKEDEWHIPFGDQMDDERLWQLVKEKYPSSEYSHGEKDHEINEYRIKIATARCARVSYLNFEGKDDYKADIALYDKLSSMGHYSPFEHCARATGKKWSGNFKGFIQLRKTLQNENKKDPRVIIK